MHLDAWGAPRPQRATQRRVPRRHLSGGAPRPQRVTQHNVPWLHTSRAELSFSRVPSRTTAPTPHSGCDMHSALSHQIPSRRQGGALPSVENGPPQHIGIVLFAMFGKESVHSLQPFKLTVRTKQVPIPLSVNDIYHDTFARIKKDSAHSPQPVTLTDE